MPRQDPFVLPKVADFFNGKGNFNLYEIASDFLGEKEVQSPVDQANEGKKMSPAQHDRALAQQRIQAKNLVIQKFYASIPFKKIFESVGRDAVTTAYTQMVTPWRNWVGVSDSKDFRPKSTIKAGVIPEPRLVLEGAEYKRVFDYGESSSSTIKTYGDIIHLTRQILLEQTPGAYKAFFDSVASAYDRLIARKVSDILLNNPSFEGLELFHQDRGNVVTKTSSFADDLGTAIDALTSQKIVTDDGEEILSLPPKYAIVPPNDVTKISAAVKDYNAAVPEQLRISVLPEARIKGFNGWFLATDKQNSSVTLHKLQGTNGPEFMMMDEFKIDGVRVKHRWDIEVSITDYRGLVRVQ